MKTRMRPALACLLYPALVWCIPAVSSAFLILAVAVPVWCAYAAFRLTGSNFRIACAVAHFGVGAPALYSLMGGWLDFQRALPFHANEAWIAIWLILAGLVLTEKPSVRSGTTAPSRLAFVHGVSAVPILLFAVVHLTNHLTGLWSGQA